MPGTASAWELLWTVIAGCGFLSALWVVFDAYHDLRAPETRADTILSRVAVWNLWVANGIGVVLTVFAGVGARALTLPSQTPSGEPDAGAILTALAFVGSELVLTAIPLTGVWLRRWVKTQGDAQERARQRWSGEERRQSP